MISTYSNRILNRSLLLTQHNGLNSLQSCWTSLESCQECLRILVVPHPHQHLIMSFLWISAILKLLGRLLQVCFFFFNRILLLLILLMLSHRFYFSFNFSFNYAHAFFKFLSILLIAVLNSYVQCYYFCHSLCFYWLITLLAMRHNYYLHI